jgi:hypothetical protein
MKQTKTAAGVLLLLLLVVQCQGPQLLLLVQALHSGPPRPLPQLLLVGCWQRAAVPLHAAAAAAAAGCC